MPSGTPVLSVVVSGNGWGLQNLLTWQGSRMMTFLQPLGSIPTNTPLYAITAPFSVMASSDDSRINVF